MPASHGHTLPPALADSPLPYLLNGGALMVGAVALGLSVTALSPVRGLVQRLGEVTLFGSIVLLAVIVKDPFFL